MQSHHLPTPLKGHGQDTTVYWSMRPSGQALIFVHGFRGSSVETWDEFAGMIQQRPEVAGADLIFYGYESLRRRARMHALELRDFIRALASNPLRLMRESLSVPVERPEAFYYPKLTLVAHSLGAIVCRQMLLDARRDGEGWRHRAELVLFAPAHMGADILLLEREIPRPGFTWIIALAARYKAPILLDLTPECQTLRLLLDGTREALSSGEEPSLVARKVIIGADDLVISPNQFASDPVPVRVPRMGHIDVCKPSDGYTLPLTEVLSVL